MSPWILKEGTPPVILFLAGLLIIPPFFLQQDLLIKGGQVLLFAFLAIGAGKRLKPLYFIILAGSITFFELLLPVGKVLLSVGPLIITAGSLERGLLKGFTIVGLVFISLFTIRRDLTLPGALGGLLGRVFFYFELIFTARSRVNPKAFIASLDTILFELHPPGSHERGAAGFDAPGTGDLVGQNRTRPAGIVFLGGLVALNWGLLFISIS
ncbi:MAG: hypothetical protein KAU17_05730 [Spirochaetales bacterium]|nr:hypothetical protein [Spirochaetales bacterium]